MIRDRLTKRQQATYDLLVKAYSYREIAEELDMVVSGVASMVQRIYKLLDIYSREELMYCHYEQLLAVKDKQIAQLEKELIFAKESGASL